MDGQHLPSDKDALISSPREESGYVLSTVNQYPSPAADGDWHGALIEETSAFRADVEQFGDFHTLLWDADREQTLDVRNDAYDSAVSTESARVPETHIENRFAFDDGTDASLEQDVVTCVDRPALAVHNRASFEASEASEESEASGESTDRTVFSVVNSSIHAGEDEEGGDRAHVVTAEDGAGDEYECLVSTDGERHFAVALHRPETGQRSFDGRRVGVLGETEGDDKSAWHDIYGENDGYIDSNEAGEGSIDLGFGLHVGDDREVEWTTAVGFGRTEEEAVDAATTTLAAGYDAEREAFADAWETWHEGVADGPTDDDAANDMYERSLTSIKCAQDPTGATVAGVFEPNEQGYRFVWPRDQVFIVAALLAADAETEAREALAWLDDKQIDDDTTDDRDIPRGGTWWQNYRSDGEPHWRALQLDQVGGPVYAHWLVWQETGDDAVLDDYYAMSRRAAEFLLGYDDDGFPGKSQDPWEEVWGHSTEGSAAAIAGLRAMAEMADERGDDAFADDCRATADEWAGTFDDYCFREDGYLGDHYVTAAAPESGGGGVAPDERPDAAAFMACWPWNVVAADGETMRSTVELADDPAWRAGDTPCVGRYPEDDYTPSSEPEDGGWPICEAFADAVRWLDGDEDALRDHLFDDAPTWTTATGLLPEQVDGDGTVRWNANLQWSQAMYVLLAESYVRDEPYGMAPAPDAE
ncbi:glycoside hydrolase family 15 protein [Candidatus Halobonum tyrrellensis]|uniref:Glucan 1,4-alpha-glucosidase n=1 Tax=Candidatus Halobonum tyrrellensis G22 TaxID=1324957 RepID=V4HPZ3_9EURY|nr:glycoside hydrolase family 15 protein [Candidatus Halobonum tyrrellensis]ESP89984.1 glucan 1,4-alpha-glucosidase [Candidatus Halobonum tyrrellensis G22]